MKSRLRLLVAVFALIVCAGLGAYLVMNRVPPAPPPPKPAPEAKSPVEVQKKVKLYQVTVEGNEAKLRPTEKEVKVDHSPPEAALRALIEQVDTGELANPIPKGTRLLGFKLEKGLATVDLSREFRDNFTGGSEEEGLTIGAVLRTLGQFPEVKRVTFLIEGKPLETLGHLDLSGPQDVRWAGSQFGGEN
jgi:germination protein M